MDGSVDQYADEWIQNSRTGSEKKERRRQGGREKKENYWEFQLAVISYKKDRNLGQKRLINEVVEK